MALPYDTKVVLPFDIATAQDMNERHANDVALANGSGLDDGAVTSDKIDFATLMATTPVTVTTQSGYTDDGCQVFTFLDGNMMYGYIALSKNSGNWSTSETHVANLNFTFGGLTRPWRGMADMSGADTASCLIGDDGEITVQALRERTGAVWFTFTIPLI